MWIETFRARVLEHPQRSAVVWDGGTLTYGQLWDASANAAADAPRLGRRRPIVDQHPVATLQQMIGAWQGGDVPAPLLKSLPEPVRAALLARLALPPPAPATADPEDGECVILTTSGSTGAPKAAVLPHRTYTRSVPLLRDLYDAGEEAGMLLGVSLGRSAAIPIVLTALASGWTLHVFPEGTPPPVLQAAMRQRRVTVLNAQPSFYRLFLAYWRGDPFTGVERVNFGGEPAGATLVNQLRAAFPNASLRVGYGMTESGSRLASLPVDDPRYARGGVGHLLPHFQASVRPVDGVAAPAGELMLRGPALFFGYLDASGAYTGLEPDGAFATGDLCEIDASGFLTYRGRCDGVFKVGGQRVNGNQVEAAIRTVPGVQAVRCGPIPHAILGNVIAAEVTTEPGTGVTEEQVMAACKAHLEPALLPRRIRMVAAPEVPDAGKMKREVLHVD